MRLEGLADSPGDKVSARGFWPSAASAAAQMYPRFLPLGRSFLEARRRFDFPASLEGADENGCERGLPFAGTFSFRGHCHISHVQ